MRVPPWAFVAAAALALALGFAVDKPQVFQPSTGFILAGTFLCAGAITSYLDDV